ncbi:MAG: RluA family pseudouridine synthase [Zetaproteobacteria bacterium]|nr:RluA family pseudouridine synthase [Zetaproteobacteria bacterium]
MQPDQQDIRLLGPQIPVGQAGLRIDQYLSRNFLFLSREKWISRLRAREVYVDGRPVKPAYRLRSGSQLSYFAPASREPEVDANLSTVWEQDGVAVMYKPANLPMHEGGAYRVNTFHQCLHQVKGRSWSSVHRLDRETSGLVLCADTSAARETLSAGLRERKTQKTYYAIVHGQCQKSHWRVDQPLGPIDNTLFRLKHGVTPNGLPSQTDFEVLDSTGAYSLLKVKPLTGRTHQIRLHAAFSGHPLVGEKKYFPDESIYLERLEKGFTARVEAAALFDRLCLHAAELEFALPGHPAEMQQVVTELPQDMEDIWQQLVRNSSSRFSHCSLT